MPSGPWRRGRTRAAWASCSGPARDRGLRELDDLIRTRTEYTLEFRREYLTRNIGFTLGDEEKRGLLRFAELLGRHGAFPVSAPRFDG